MICPEKRKYFTILQQRRKRIADSYTNFDLRKNSSRKEHNKIGKIVKCKKYGLAKFADFVYDCIIRRNYHFEPKMVTISACNINVCETH